MISQLTGSKRIAANTAFSYSRTLISIALALFSSRWVLEGLGTVDFGLYSLVGSILAIVLFLNKVLANGDARFFALGIGKNDQVELNKVFNTLLSLHIAMPFILTAIGFVVGEFVMRHYLVIPPERLQASIIVFRITMLVSLLTMMTVPFSSLFVAYQNIFESTLFSLLQTFLMFISAYSLRLLPNSSDKLIIYSIMVSLVSVTVTVIMVVTSCRRYKCTAIRTKCFFDRKLSLDVLKYSFWNMLGDLGHLIRAQGTSVIVNLYFGPTGNAALGIANQVSIQSSNLTNAMASSTRPEIFRRAGEGNLLSAFSLSDLSSRIGLFLIFVVSVPVLFNLDSLLAFWLVNVPTGTNVLCKCFIFMFVIEKMTIGQNSYLNAIGRVALVNTLKVVFYCTALVFPFCGLLQFGLAGIGLSCLLSMILTRCSIIYCTQKYTNFDILRYFKTTVTPTVLLLMILFFLLQIRFSFHSERVVQLALSVLFVFVVTVFAGMVLFFNKDERLRIAHLFTSKIKKA